MIRTRLDEPRVNFGGYERFEERFAAYMLISSKFLSIAKAVGLATAFLSWTVMCFGQTAFVWRVVPARSARSSGQLIGESR